MKESHNIIGSWIHSKEEDSDDTLVYRPNTHDFPPSRRARERIELSADGSAAHSDTLGADDRPEYADGSWSLNEDTLTVDIPSIHKNLHFQIRAVDDDRLVLAPAAEENGDR